MLVYFISFTSFTRVRAYPHPQTYSAKARSGALEYSTLPKYKQVKGHLKLCFHGKHVCPKVTIFLSKEISFSRNLSWENGLIQARCAVVHQGPAAERRIDIWVKNAILGFLRATVVR